MTVFDVQKILNPNLAFFEHILHILLCSTRLQGPRSRFLRLRVVSADRLGDDGAMFKRPRLALAVVRARA